MSQGKVGRAVKRGFIFSAGLAAAFLIAQGAAATDLSSVKIGTADLIPTSTTYYGNGTTHTFDILNPGAGNELCSPASTVCPPEIRELARALKNNVDLIYDYVHNNIDTVWMFGLQKGPLGALIDKSGTPFDQAMLMVELLRWSGYTAGYKFGTITPSQSDFDNATDITDAKAACQLLSGGAIPANITNNLSVPVPADCSTSGSIGSITMNHVWVWVTISGTTYLFDPSFKAYAWKPTLTWTDPAIMGFVSGQAFTAAQSGMASGNDSAGGKTVAYVGNLNATQLNAKIQAYANTLLTYLASNLQGGEIEDLVGGGTIAPAYTAQNPQRQTSLAGHTATKTWNDIPNQYRTTLTVSGTMYDMKSSHDETMFDRLFYVDEIYGRRLTIETDFYQGGIPLQGDWYNNKVFLKLDDALVPMQAPYTNPYVNTPPTTNPQQTSRGVPATITLTASHPYAASGGSYMDTTITKPATIITSLVVVHGWGDVSQALFTKWTEERDIGPNLPTAYIPHCVGNPTEVCPDFYKNQRGDLLRERAAASWLAQNTRAARLNAALANATFQMHHAIGIIYGDARLTQIPKCPEPIPTCTVYRSVVADSFDRVDVDMGFSLAHKTADATVRRGAVHTIAASSAALEGSVMAQLADLPDTASTATRFEWGNSPPSSEDPFGGWRKFELYDNNNRTAAPTLVIAEGVTSSGNDGVAPWGSAPELSGGEIGIWRGALSSTIDAYAQAGFLVATSQESFLGSGQRGGIIVPSPADIPVTYTHYPTKQRGGAFVATRYVNGEPVEIAHIVLGLNTTAVATIVTKGGGGSQQPDTAIAYNPSEAADVLKARFVDRSTALGVNLSNGSIAFTSPASLSVGNSGFPYELSAGLIWHPGPRIRIGAPDSPTLPQPGWTTSWHNSASLSGSGMEAMGQSDIRAAAGTIASFLVGQDIYKTSQSLARDAAGVLAISWWTHQMQGNVVSITVGGATRQMLKLANNTWITPGAGYATLVQTGTRTPFEEICTDTAKPVPPYAMARGWNISTVSFDLTSANGDAQHFANWKNNYGTTDEDRCGHLKGFRFTTWTFPYGVTVTVDYGNPYDPFSATPEIERITGVHNNVGRTITYSYTGSRWYFPSTLADGAQATRKVTVLDNDNHRDPIGNETDYTYVAPVVTGPNQRPIPYSRLYRVFTAENLSVPNLEYTYDMLGRVKEASDAVALQIGGRNPYGFFIADGTRGERIDPLGQSYVVDYDIHGRPARYIDEMAHITLADIDGRGRVVSYTYPEGDQETFQYDTHNNTTEFRRKAKPNCTTTPPTEPAGGCNDIVVSATWNQTWNKPATIVNARGFTTDFAYYSSANGAGLIQNAQLQAAAAGGVRPRYSFTYDNRGKVLTASTPIGTDGTQSIVTTNIYDATYRNLTSSTYDSGASPHIAALTTYGYDATASQDVTRITDPRGNVTDATYDPNRRKTYTMAHNGDAGALLIAETRTTYDAVGRVTKEEAAKCFDTASPCLSSGTTVQTWIATRTVTYTPTSKPDTVTDADNRVTTTAYDGLDRVLTVTDPASRQTHFVFCALADANCAANAVRVVQRAYGTTFQQDYATYTYTLNGKQRTVLDADGGGHLTTFTYDHFDRVVSTIFPDFPDATHEDLVYYASGALCSANGTPCQRITRAGDTIAYTYDRLDRTATKIVPGASGRTTTWTYDLAGRVELLTDTLGHSIDPHYDTAGRIDQNTRTVPGLTGTQTVSYQHDAVGNRTRITWPGGSYFVQYGFDPLNRMASASENNTFTLANFTYDALSRRTKIDYAPSTNGAHVTYAYTDADDLTALDHDMSGSGDDAQFDFTYTTAHQMASMAQSDPDFLWQATGTCADTYTHNDLNQYPTIAWCGGGAQTHTWSPNGNLTGANIDGTGWTYTYDPENRLLTAAKSGLTVTYAYDPLDHRVSRAATSQSTVFFLGDTEDDEIGDYNADGTPIQRYIPGPAIDRPIAMVTAAGTRTYFHTDRLGSVIALSGDTSAKTEGPYTYDPYGRPCGVAGTSTCTIASSGEPFRFTGRRLDPDTRLYYYRARYYSFDIGRFLQTDAVGYQADLNLYTYVGNDPANRTDPNGNCPPRVCGGEGMAINVLADPPSGPGRVYNYRSVRNWRPQWGSPGLRGPIDSRAPIHGNPQNTGQNTHASTSARVAEENARLPSTERVHLNQFIRTIFGQAFSGPNLRGDVTTISKPDAAGVRNVQITEVRSPTQTAEELSAKYDAALRSLPSGFRALPTQVVDPDPIFAVGAQVPEAPMVAPEEPTIELSPNVRIPLADIIIEE